MAGRRFGFMPPSAPISVAESSFSQLEWQFFDEGMWHAYTRMTDHLVDNLTWAVEQTVALSAGDDLASPVHEGGVCDPHLQVYWVERV